VADKTAKVDGQPDGPYYVDTNCISCEACVQTAPDFFVMEDDSGLAIVVKQPQNDDEKAECEEALEACPVEAIGNDG